MFFLQAIRKHCGNYFLNKKKLVEIQFLRVRKYFRVTLRFFLFQHKTTGQIQLKLCTKLLLAGEMAANKVIKINTYIFGKNNSNSTYRLEIRVYTQVVNNGFFGKKFIYKWIVLNYLNYSRRT